MFEPANGSFLALSHDLFEDPLITLQREIATTGWGTIATGAHGLAGAPKTPPTWRDAHPHPVVDRFGSAMVTLAHSLGTPFGWVTQQAGRTIHEIVPQRGSENEQIGSNSLTPLNWHNEDAFDENRPDYVILGCVRNPLQVPTSLATINDIEPLLSPATIGILSQPRFQTMVDASHTTHRRKTAPFALWDSARRRLRIDAPHTRTLDKDDALAAFALHEFCTAVEECLFEHTLTPGDILVVDNHRVVHGRKAFRPSYDGSDRWLRRILVTTTPDRVARRPDMILDD